MKYFCFLLVLILILFNQNQDLYISVAPPLKLESFASVGNRGEVKIDVTDRIYTVALLDFDKQPSAISNYLNLVTRERKYDVGNTNDKGIIKLNLKEKSIDHSNLIVFLRCLKICNVEGYMEVLRQSSDLLKKRWSFNKPDGYSIIARSSIQLPEDKKVFYSSERYSVPYKEKITSLSISSFYPEKSLDPAIDESVAIMRYIWDGNITTGPNNYRSAASLDPIERLSLIRQGKWSVQCADTRNIFLDLAISSPKISHSRYVGLYLYYPPFRDLITPSHAVAEIYSENLQKWIMVDPWFGAIYRLGNKYLSAADINQMTPTERKLIVADNFVSTRLSPIGQEGNSIYLEYGYFSYFGAVEYGPIEKGNFFPS